MKNPVSLPATLQMDSNQLQNSATSANATGITVVESAEALAQLTGVKMAMLVGHNEGSTKGGGNFIYQPEGSGLRIGEWLFQSGQTVTPYHFGAFDGSWNEDSGAALQRFFDFLATPQSRNYQVFGGGSFGTRIPLVARGLGGVYGFDLTIQALEGMDDVITANNCRDSIWIGRLKIKVSQDSWLQRRKGVNGFRIEDSRGAKFCDIEAYMGSGWAVYYASGNNNMSTVGNIAAQDMGASTRTNQEHKVTSIGYSNYERNTLWQNTTITLSPGSRIPSDAHQMGRAFWVSVAGEPYKIRSVNRENNTITVYPMVPDAEQVMGDHHLVYGGGICNYAGGHTAKGRVGHVYPMRCGIGMWITGQSSANVDGYTGQSNGIDMVLGSNPENVFGGSFIGSVYFEWSRIADLIFMSETGSQYNYGTIFGSCTNLDFPKWYSMGYKRTNTPANRGGKQNFPVAFMNGGELWSPGAGSARSLDAATYLASATNHYASPQFAQPLRNATSIHLTHHVQEERFRGIHPITFYLYGQRGANGSYHQSIPITCAEGYTINDKPGPLNIANRNAPVTLHALLERGNNWIVTLTEHQAL